jgi:hypothetical protein
MFGMSDLITCAVIKEGLEFFSKHPTHLEFILGGFCQEPLYSMVGADHLHECISFVTQNKINVVPYYQLDGVNRPCIAVVSSGNEVQQFIGDFGRFGDLPSERLPPRVYAMFDALGIDNFRTGLLVSSALGLEKLLWPGVLITNGAFSATLRGINTTDGQPTRVHLESEIPENTPLNGWRAQSFVREKGIEVHNSMDQVNVQCQLITTGDPSIHRLLSVVLRACLKRGRPTFDKYGMQIATFGYQPIQPSENTEMEFTSVYSVEARFTDSWIYKEFDLADPSANVLVCSTVVPVEVIPDVKEEVPLE